MRNIYSVWLVFLLMIGCNNTPSQVQTDFEALLQEVLDEHDEIMKEVGKVNSLIRQLDEKKDTLSNTSSYDKAELALKDAHESMFDWMHDFSEEFPDVSKKEMSYSDAEYEEMLGRLNDQKKKLDRVDVLFKESIENAYDLIGN